jgi:hypothetical protein
MLRKLQGDVARARMYAVIFVMRCRVHHRFFADKRADVGYARIQGYRPMRSRNCRQAARLFGLVREWTNPIQRGKCSQLPAGGMSGTASDRPGPEISRSPKTTGYVSSPAAAMSVIDIPRSRGWVPQFASIVPKSASTRVLAARCDDWVGPCTEPATPLREKACLNSRLEKSWWRRRGSNPRPPHCERGALPAELRPHRLKIIARRRLHVN